MTHFRLIAISALLCLLAGCGGSSTKTSSSASSQTTSTSTTEAATTSTTPNTSGKPLTREAFLTAADAICASTNAKRAQYRLSSNRAYIHDLPIVATYERIEVGEMEKLIPPASLKKDWHEIIAGNQRLSENSVKVASYMSAGDSKNVNLVLTSAGADQRRMLALARKDGFKDCSMLS